MEHSYIHNLLSVKEEEPVNDSDEDPRKAIIANVQSRTLYNYSYVQYLLAKLACCCPCCPSRSTRLTKLALHKQSISRLSKELDITSLVYQLRCAVFAVSGLLTKR